MDKLAISTKLLHGALGKMVQKARAATTKSEQLRLHRQEQALVEGIVKRQKSHDPGTTKTHAELMRLMAKAERVPGKPPKLNKPINDDLVPRVDVASVVKGNETRGYPYSTKFFRVKKYTDRD